MCGDSTFSEAVNEQDFVARVKSKTPKKSKAEDSLPMPNDLSYSLKRLKELKFKQ